MFKMKKIELRDFRCYSEVSPIAFALWGTPSPQGQGDDRISDQHEDDLGSKTTAAAIDSPYLTAEEAASYLRTTVQGIYSLVKHGKLQPMPGCRKLRFTRQALDKALATRRRRRH